MAAGLPDLVDCATSAAESAVIERVFEFGDFSRVRDMLFGPGGRVVARFAFTTLAAGRSGARVSVRATPRLVCQRCMQGFELSLSGSSELEFVAGPDAESADSEREVFTMKGGQVSLRELAEEELLLALPIAPSCTTPLTCGKAPNSESDDASGVSRRPFSALKDLLKKT